MSNNFNNMLEQREQKQQTALKNTNVNNFNNFGNLSSSSSSYDYLGLFILVAMLIKACAQIPLIIKITQTKSAEDISIIMPIMFLTSFSILGAISLSRKLYFPLLIFAIGIATSIILIIQISMYEKSKDTSEPVQYPSKETPDNKPIDFQFPDPKSVYNNQS
jgi:uncharacterized protein with PQ loop repeat